MKIFSLLTVLICLSCGAERKDNSDGTNSQDRLPVPSGGTPTNQNDQEQNPIIAQNEDGKIVKAGWDFTLSRPNSVPLTTSRLRSVSEDVPVSGVVPLIVRFVVNTENFQSPTPAEGPTDYGTIDITRVRDNSLRQCGNNQDEKCVGAQLRIYTVGDGPGFWNATEGYGVPISSSGQAVGHTKANALVLKEITIGNQRVVRLAHFTSDDAFRIPISIDFTDAAVGSYETTIRIEYVIF